MKNVTVSIDDGATKTVGTITSSTIVEMFIGMDDLVDSITITGTLTSNVTRISCTCNSFMLSGITLNASANDNVELTCENSALSTGSSATEFLMKISVSTSSLVINPSTAPVQNRCPYCKSTLTPEECAAKYGVSQLELAQYIHTNGTGSLT